MKEFDDKIIAHWQEIAPLLTIRNESEYNTAIRRLNELLDEIGTNEKHPLYNLFDILGTLIYAYEEEHYTISEKQFKRASQYVLQKNAKLYKSFLTDVVYSLCAWERDEWWRKLNLEFK